MCGATQEQKQMQASQAKFYDEMTANYKAVFGQQQAILAALTAQFKPILEAGPSQRGFSQEQRDAMETASIENVGRNFAHAKQTLEENLAARGGDDFLPSGADTQLETELSATAAEDRSSQQNQIVQADYNQGHQNWAFATGALSQVANELNPVGTSNSATGAGEAAATTANQIAQASNSIWGSVIGGLSGIAGQAVGGWAGGMKAKPATGGGG
jgi:hypothetical protein